MRIDNLAHTFHMDSTRGWLPTVAEIKLPYNRIGES
jgi:hypothetical protein